MKVFSGTSIEKRNRIITNSFCPNNIDNAGNNLQTVRQRTRISPEVFGTVGQRDKHTSEDVRNDNWQVNAMKILKT